MAIDQPDKIDAIGIDNESGNVVLTISDHLPWIGEAEEHRELLRDKLNAYLAFIESGQLIEVYPEAIGKTVAVCVAGKFDLSSIGTEFFANANQVMAGAGVSLRFKKM